MSASHADPVFLEAAVAWGSQACYRTAPNPAVGCLLVQHGRVIGRGATEPAGGRHAEIVALDDARVAGQPVAGATAYVSLEPCAFEGRTPPCADALIKAGVVRVVGALTDPHPRVAGAGYAKLVQAGIAVERYELASAAANVRGFLTRQRTGRPLVRVKIAASLDARTAMASGESQWITGSAARAEVQEWRARSCAVLTGSGTVLADDPALTVRDERYADQGRLRQPLRVVLDSRRRIAATAKVFTGPGSALRLYARGLAATGLAAGAEQALAQPATALQASSHQLSSDPTVPEQAVAADAEGRLDLAAVLDLLGRRQCNEVLVESGPTLAGRFLALGLWDEAVIYLAPKLLGSSARPLAQLALDRLAQAIRGTIVEATPVGDDLRIRFLREIGNEPIAGGSAGSSVSGVGE